MQIHYIRLSGVFPPHSRTCNRKSQIHFSGYRVHMARTIFACAFGTSLWVMSLALAEDFELLGFIVGEEKLVFLT